MSQPLSLLRQYLGRGGCGYQLQMIPDQINPLPPLLDLKEDEGSCYISGNRLEIHTKQFRLANIYNTSDISIPLTLYKIVSHSWTHPKP